MLLTAAALATSRIRLGTLVTPVARRRPQQLARQVATLDALSGGRVIFAAGLGGPIEDEYGSFGDPTDPVVLAERLDEGLDLLARYWSGEPVNHDGPHYRGTRRDAAARDGPAPSPAGLDRRLLAESRPDAPRRPLGRRRPAVRLSPAWAGPGRPEVRDLVAYAPWTATPPSSSSLGGVSPQTPRRHATLSARCVDAGATWWDERQLQSGDDLDKLDPVLRRVEQGPPF